jgi:pyrimidine operon attenuation protein/uracil phosphoribosyltransferase
VRVSAEVAAAAGAMPVMAGAAMRRALVRIAHEVVERHPDTERLILAGIRSRGAPLAERIAASIQEFEGVEVERGSLDIGLHRDDLSLRGVRPALQPSELPASLDGRVVVLVDDVLFTGRSIRAALDALIDYGRPAAIELAVLVDRGHRELPIRPDYVGKNVPTHWEDDVVVRLSEVDGVDEVLVVAADVVAGERDAEGVG